MFRQTLAHVTLKILDQGVGPLVAGAQNDKGLYNFGAF